MEISPEEAAHRAASDTELVAWVDEQDRLLGCLPRAQLCRDRLIGRGTFILLFNSQGELCVHKRTQSKALYPGYWDVAAGGMVACNESYEQSAERELAEELGISGVVLQSHGRFFYSSSESRLWCGVYSALSDAPLTLQPEEVVEAVFMTVDQALQLAQQMPCCPDSLQALKHYLAL